MRDTHTKRVDLNLIPPLVALLEEQQVSRAAERVGLSQPAMSRALQRLRRLLDDPLLIRDATGYRLTARAVSIQAQLTTVLPQLEMLFAPEHFDPRTATAPLHLAATDYAVQAFGPAICREVLHQSRAPVRFHSWTHDGVAEQIRDSHVDLGLFGGYTAAHLHAEELLVERFVCLVARDHPLAGHDRITLADYVQAGHVVVDVQDGVQPDIDRPLQKLGRSRHAAVTVPYHSVAAQLLPGSDLIATLPSQFVNTLTTIDDIRVLDAPDEIATMEYRMVWHPAFDNDGRHLWLRDVVRTAVRRTLRQSARSGHGVAPTSQRLRHTVE